MVKTSKAHSIKKTDKALAKFCSRQHSSTSLPDPDPGLKKRNQATVKKNTEVKKKSETGERIWSSTA
jgi:hypothetical protein